MTYELPKEIPIRSKIEMAKNITTLIHCLHQGEALSIDLLIEQLKTRAVYMDEKIQQAVLVFVEQVEFQHHYDPWHKITSNIQHSADQLLENLGFMPEKMDE